MPAAPQGVTIEPNGQSVVVVLTEQGGGSPIVYANRHGTATVSMPATITTRTTLFLVDPTAYTVSCKVGGLENANGAGGTATIDLSGGGVATVGVGVPVETDTIAKSTYVPLTTGLGPAAKTPPKPIDTVFTTFDSGHGFTVTQGGTAGDNLNAAASGILAAQGVTLVTDGAGTSKRLDRTSGLTIDLTNRSPVLWLTVDDTTHLAALEVWFGLGGFGTTYRFAPWNSVSTDIRLETIQPGVPVRVAIPWSAQTLINTFGTPTRGNLNAIRVQVTDDNTGNPVTVRLGGVGSMPEPRGAWPHGVVTLCFDDAYGTQFSVAKPAMDKYGFPGTAHVICENVNAGAPSLTLTQLRAMQDLSGWHVGAHAYSIANHNTVGGFPALPAAVTELDMQQNRNWLLSNGFEDSEHFAYPQGFFDDTTLKIVARYFRSARSTISRSQEVWPPAEPLKMRVRNVTSTTTVAQVQGWIDDAYTNAFWLVLVFHDFNAAPTNGNQYTPANFQLICDYLYGKGIPVRTTRDVLETRHVRHAESHAAGQVDDLYLNGGHAVTTGVETFSRLDATAGVAMSSGTMRLTAVTPTKDTTITSLAVSTGGTAGVGITLSRLGLYTVNSDGSITLVAATLSDTTVGATASTLYTKSLDAGGGLPTSYTMKRGVRYAMGWLEVATTTSPNGVGCFPGAATNAVSAISPWVAAQVNGLGDLPTTVAVGSVAKVVNALWMLAA